MELLFRFSADVTTRFLAYGFLPPSTRVTYLSGCHIMSYICSAALTVQRSGHRAQRRKAQKPARIVGLRLWRFTRDCVSPVCGLVVLVSHKVWEDAPGPSAFETLHYLYVGNHNPCCSLPPLEEIVGRLTHGFSQFDQPRER